MDPLVFFLYLPSVVLCVENLFMSSVGNYSSKMIRHHVVGYTCMFESDMNSRVKRFRLFGMKYDEKVRTSLFSRKFICVSICILEG